MSYFDDEKMADILRQYPPEKPVCFNYMMARDDIFTLCDALKELQFQIDRMESLHQKGA